MTTQEVMGSSYPGKRPGTEDDAKPTLLTVPIRAPAVARKIEDEVMRYLSSNARDDNVRLLAHLVRTFGSWLMAEVKPGNPQAEVEVIIRTRQFWTDEWTTMAVREARDTLEIEAVDELGVTE